MIQIKNKKSLTAEAESSRTRQARTLALDCLEYSVNAVDAAKLLRAKVALKNNRLNAGSYCFDLSKFRRVFVVGGGKAAGAMAHALEDVLGIRITAGFVNVPHGDQHKTNVIKLQGASHPVPDEAGVEGARKMLRLVEQADEHDLVVVLLSGGGSSLMPFPREGISLEHKRELTGKLLKSGAKIDEINVVRKHLSCFKGGWLAKKAFPASVLNLIVSDVVGDSLESIASGPSVPDSSTFSDVRRVLERYDLWKSAPSSVRKLVLEGEKGVVEETPKSDDACFTRVSSVVLGNCRVLALAAVDFLKSKSLNTLLLTSSLEGEAKTVGTILSSIACEAAVSGKPVVKPAAIVAGGETVVTVHGKGVGGRNQELALSAALKLQDLDGAVVASLSSDGVDGPTDAAGAIVDGKTLQRAGVLGLDAEAFLADNDSYGFFSKLGGLIFTGATGTNVNDISLIVVL
jgi:glycerate-2-kinase